MTTRPVSLTGPAAIFWLLLAINLLNYLDRYILAAVLPKIESEFLAGDANPKFWSNLLATAFLVSYTIIAPLFGWLGDRLPSRWLLIGIGIILWSVASGASGLATTYMILFLTRCLIGVGEGAYSPVGMALLSDAFKAEQRGRVIAAYSLAIPVGSALGFMYGGLMADTALGWRWAFYLVVPPGLLLGTLCFLMRDPGRARAQIDPSAPPRPPMRPSAAYAACLRNRSYVLAVAGYTAMTFVVGGVSTIMPSYVFERQGEYRLTPEVLETLAKVPAITPPLHDKLAAIGPIKFAGADTFKAALRETFTPAELAPIWGTVRSESRTAESPKLGPIGTNFGGITVLAGLTATLTGAWLAGLLRRRLPSSDFFVSGVGALLGLPPLMLFLYRPFPEAWFWLFWTIFFLFVNTGPINTTLANVTPSRMRANAFALSILIMHALGDVISPPILGLLTDVYDWRTALYVVSAVLTLAGLCWLVGMRFLVADIARAEADDAAG